MAARSAPLRHNVRRFDPRVFAADLPMEAARVRHGVLSRRLAGQLWLVGVSHRCGSVHQAAGQVRYGRDCKRQPKGTRPRQAHSALRLDALSMPQPRPQHLRPRCPAPAARCSAPRRWHSGHQGLGWPLIVTPANHRGPAPIACRGRLGGLDRFPAIRGAPWRPVALLRANRGLPLELGI